MQHGGAPAANSDDQRALTKLVKAALSASDRIGRSDVSIHLNDALVALDGLGDAGVAINLLPD